MTPFCMIRTHQKPKIPLKTDDTINPGIIKLDTGMTPPGYESDNYRRQPTTVVRLGRYNDSFERLLDPGHDNNFNPTTQDHRLRPNHDVNVGKQREIQGGTPAMVLLGGVPSPAKTADPSAAYENRQRVNPPSNAPTKGAGKSEPRVAKLNTIPRGKRMWRDKNAPPFRFTRDTFRHNISGSEVIDALSYREVERLRDRGHLVRKAIFPGMSAKPRYTKTPAPNAAGYSEFVAIK